MGRTRGTPAVRWLRVPPRCRRQCAQLTLADMPRAFGGRRLLRVHGLLARDPARVGAHDLGQGRLPVRILEARGEPADHPPRLRSIPAPGGALGTPGKLDGRRVRPRRDVPGAGKGTQAEQIRDKYDLFHISTGAEGF